MLGPPPPIAISFSLFKVCLFTEKDLVNIHFSFRIVETHIYVCFILTSVFNTIGPDFKDLQQKCWDSKGLGNFLTGPGCLRLCPEVTIGGYSSLQERSLQAEACWIFLVIPSCLDDGLEGLY